MHKHTNVLPRYVQLNNLDVALCVVQRYALIDAHHILTKLLLNIHGQTYKRFRIETHARTETNVFCCTLPSSYMKSGILHFILGS